MEAVRAAVPPEAACDGGGEARGQELSEAPIPGFL